MNHTTALCGHLVLAVGSPGSDARRLVNESLCEACEARKRNLFLINTVIYAPQPQTEHQARVMWFMRRAGQKIPEKPTMPDAETRLLRARLIFEEAKETIEALGCKVLGNPLNCGAFVSQSNEPPDMVGIVDGCADLSVVAQGTLLSCGVPDEAVLLEVDEANLRKFEGDAHRDPDTGKWIKPSDFKPPDIEGVLRKLGWEGE